MPCSLQAPEKRLVRVGLSVLPEPMTLAQARRYGAKHIPADLKRAGFVPSVYISDPEINGSSFFRVNYSK